MTTFITPDTLSLTSKGLVVLEEEDYRLSSAGILKGIVVEEPPEVPSFKAHWAANSNTLIQ